MVALVPVAVILAIMTVGMMMKAKVVVDAVMTVVAVATAVGVRLVQSKYPKRLG
jgi:hypothetical protein